MVTQTFDFFYDFGSPYTYLVHKRVPDIAARTGTTAVYKPMLLGGVFKATGNMSPVQVPLKLAYQTADIARFVQHHGLSYLQNPHFPVMTITLMRGAIFATGKSYEKTYIDIYGHTDSSGSDAYNQALSERRAVSVANYLAGRGVQRARMATLGYGESQLKCDESTEAGKRCNRRVEIRISPVTQDDVNAVR